MCDLNLLKLAKENDMNAKETLILKYSPLVRKQIKKYSYIDCYDSEDLMQHGVLSILKAIDTFDINKSSSFSSYVMWAVCNNFAYLCRGNNCERKAHSLNVQTEGGDEIIDVLVDNVDIEEDFMNSFEEKRLNLAVELLDEDFKDLFNFLMYSDVKCALKRYSEKHNIPYAKCIYKKKKLASKLRIILNTI
ncbi:sigma-70 family RNA polymerase sigma factor [Clostridium sp.]|uniref:sigma-70 family RNA polymerase sigma factor n=1 Tax=Clostridium sp. TaxID=1506 RepID=UPI002FC73E4E